jgi:nicotinamidase-related amidase
MEAARKAAPAALELVRAFRGARRPVAFAVYATARGGPMRRWWRKRCPRRSRWAKPGKGFEALRGERLFVKHGYSALKGTGCGAWLESERVTDLVVAGVMTHLCVESTVRDAFDFGFRVFVASDACASRDRSLHEAALRSIAAGFGYLVRSRNLLPESQEER